MATTLTTKGQVTIPKPIRDRLISGPAVPWNSRLQSTGASI